MNKFGQKIRDCGHPRISSARPGAAMASVRHWAVPAVMAAALMLSGCQTLNPDSAEGESNSALKTLLVAFVGGAAIWGSTGGGGSGDDSPLLPTPRAEDLNRFAGSFSQPDIREENGKVVQIRFDTPFLDRAAGDEGLPFSFLIPSNFNVAPGTGFCETPSAGVRRCHGTIERGLRFQRLILVPTTQRGADDPPPMVSLIRDNNYDILPTLGLSVVNVDQNGRITFEMFSSTDAGPDGLVGTATITGQGFTPGGSTAGQLAAIAAIVGSQANNHVTCEGRICTVTIPEGETSATFTLIPMTEANSDADAVNRWTVSLVPAGINDPFEIENGNRGAPPIEVANTPTGIRGGFSTQHTDLRQVSIQTPELNRVAGPLGFDIAFTLPNENLRPVEDQMVDVGGEMVPVMVSCVGTACTVTIPPGKTDLALLFVPTPSEFGAPTVINKDTGEISIQTPTLDTPAPSVGTTLMFTLQDNFMPASDEMGVTCIGTDCTVTILDGEIDRVVRFVPTPIDPTDTPPPVAIDLPDDQDFAVLPVFVGFSTPEPTVDPDNGEVTFTFVSETAAPPLGLAVSFRITGPAFMAMLPDDTPLVCQGNVCTVVIPAGRDRVAFVLVPQGTATTTWSVAIVPDTNNNYGFNDDSRTSVAVITTPPPAFFVGFSTPQPTVDTDTGEVTFTVVSDTPALVGGLEVSITIGGDAFIAIPLNADGTRMNTPLVCSLQNVCTITILEGSDTAAFVLVPQGRTTTTWSVAIVDVEDTSNIYGINDDSQTPVAVITTPPPAFFVGFSTPQPTVDTDTGEVTFTVVSDTPALVGGLEVSITIGGDAFIAIPLNADGTRMNTPLVCSLQNVCTITIPAGSDTAAFVLVPQGRTTTTWSVAIVDVEDTSNIYGINDDSQTPVAVITTPPPAFFVGFSTPLPTTDPDTGEVTFTVVSDTPALVGGLEVSITIGGDAFIAIPLNADGTRMNTPLVCSLQNVCTITILEGSDTAAFVLVPQGRTTTTWSVAIVDVEDTSNIYGINENSRTPVAVTTTPPPDFVVGFSGTPTPTTDPVTGEVISGEVTFTVVSDTPALVGGLEVTITIGGDAFIAIPLNADGTRMNTALDCPLNVCTITIPAGSDTATFILVPTGPRPPDSDLFERWTVAIVDDTDNIYGIDEDNPTAVVATGLLTPIAAGGTTVLDENAAVRFGDLSASFSAFGLDGALPDVLEIPSAPRVLAESGADTFASGYGYFADDGGFLPVGTDMQVEVPPALPPPNLGPTNPISGQVDITLPLLDAPAPSGGFDIEFTVSGSNSFTATLLDAVDPAARTSVPCIGNICTVTILEGATGVPNGNRVHLMPTVPVPGNPPNWMVMINTADPILPDPLSVNRANNDEAVFYARRGDKLVARFHTTGTFTETAQVVSRRFAAFSGTDSLRPFEREDFDPAPFGTMRDCGSLSGSDLTACNDFNTELPGLINAARIAHDARQTRLQGFYTSFGADFNTFLDQVCAVAEDSSMCDDSFSNENEVNLLVVDGFGGIGPLFRGDLALSEGEDVDINRPVAIALAITSTLIAAADDAQELVYSYFQDGDEMNARDGVIDLTPASEDPNGRQFDVFNTATVGSVDFALYESGDIPNAVPPSAAFSISDIDPASELLGASNVRTFLYENEFSAIGAWLIPPTDAEVTADANAPYAAAAAHWFGFETPAAGIPTGGEAVYGGIAIGDFRQVRFGFADTDSDPSTPPAQISTNVESYYVRGFAQFDADFGNGEMNGQFDLFAYDPEDVYGDPSLLLSQPLDLLVVNWDGQILPDSGAFANNFVPVTETVEVLDLNTGMPIMITRDTFAATGTIFQPLRVTDPNQQNPNRVGVFDDLVDFDRIGGVDPSQPAPISSDTRFSVFGKFFGPNAEEVGGELRVFNSLNVFLPPDLDAGGNPIPGTEIDESVTNSLEVHFTADGAPVPVDRHNP